MIDKELADKVVALGVVSHSGMWGFRLGPEGGPMWDLSEDVVRDWRVAGALMEMVSCVELAVLVNMSEWQAMAFPPDDCEAFEVINESAPRAIIEACVEALSG
jgi:hypothetical protein